MILGLVAFVVASTAVGLAPTVEVVVVARLLQGAAAGFLTPQVTGLIQQLFRGAERGRAYGLFGMTVSVASGAGPVVGGAIIGLAGEDDGWRWLFAVNIPIGLVALFFVARLVPRTPTADRGRLRLDLVGAVLLGGAVLCLLYPLVSLESGAREPLWLLVGVPVLAVAFVAWERRELRSGRDPLLDLALLGRTPGYAGGLVVGTLFFAGFTGILLVLSVHLQDAVGLTPLQTGLLLTPFALGSAVAAPLAGRVVTTIGRPLVLVALLTTMLGVLGAALLAPGAATGSLWWVLGATLLIAGVGGGAVISPNITLTLAEVPPRMGGAAGAALQTGQRVGSALGAALLVTAYGLAGGGADGLRAALLTAVVVLAATLLAAVATRATAPGDPAATTAADG